LDLSTRAFEALRKEDKAVWDALVTKGDFGDDYCARSAPGIGYWVFEHNIVYEIFKAWAPKYRVLWDEKPTASWPGSVALSAAPANDSRFPDLQVVMNPKKDVRWFFEAKWLNNKAKASVEKDVKKLRNLHTRPKSSRAFLIGIWNNVLEKRRSDIDWISDIDGADAVFLGWFTSRVRTRREAANGYHFVAVLEVE
jgi:hypothetical protein